MENSIIKILSQKYFILVNLVLITAFIGVGTGTMYNIITVVVDNYTETPVENKKLKKFSVKRKRKKTLASYSAIAKRNLFKTDKGVKIKPVDPGVVTKKFDDFGLKLQGTIVAGKEYSRAIIVETKSRQQKLYKIGESIQTATLTHILRNKVYFNVNGETEYLDIEKKSVKGGRGGRTSQSSSRRDRSGGSTKPKDIVVPRELIEDSMQNLNKLMKDVRIRPHFKNGESDGLIVSGIKGGSVFKKLGLRNGDIIMGVDGSKIESVDDAMKLYSGLKDMENMKMEIKRRGRMQTLNFNIE